MLAFLLPLASKIVDAAIAKIQQELEAETEKLKIEEFI